MDVCVLTGVEGEGGISLARILVERGYRVYAFASEKRDWGLAHLDFVPLECPQHDIPQAEAMLHAILDHEKSISAVVHLAHAFNSQSFQELSAEQLVSQVQRNLTLPLLVNKILLPGVIQARGHLLQCCQPIGKGPRMGGTLYLALEDGMMRFYRRLYEEVRSKGVRVTCIRPVGILGGGQEQETSVISGEFLAESIAGVLFQQGGGFFADLEIRPEPLDTSVGTVRPTQPVSLASMRLPPALEKDQHKRSFTLPARKSNAPKKRLEWADRPVDYGPAPEVDDDDEDEDDDDFEESAVPPQRSHPQQKQHRSHESNRHPARNTPSPENHGNSDRQHSSERQQPERQHSDRPQPDRQHHDRQHPDRQQAHHDRQQSDRPEGESSEGRKRRRRRRRRGKHREDGQNGSAPVTQGIPDGAETRAPVLATNDVPVKEAPVPESTPVVERSKENVSQQPVAANESDRSNPPRSNRNRRRRNNQHRDPRPAVENHSVAAEKAEQPKPAHVPPPAPPPPPPPPPVAAAEPAPSSSPSPSKRAPRKKAAANEGDKSAQRQSAEEGKEVPVKKVVRKRAPRKKASPSEGTESES
jgi:NAD(P)-dependent dehydrogenase (short-subunit alcohol dehydrogenase family)